MCLCLFLCPLLTISIIRCLSSVLCVLFSVFPFAYLFTICKTAIFRKKNTKNLVHFCIKIVHPLSEENRLTTAYKTTRHEIGPAQKTVKTPIIMMIITIKCWEREKKRNKNVGTFDIIIGLWSALYKKFCVLLTCLIIWWKV